MMKSFSDLFLGHSALDKLGRRTIDADNADSQSGIGVGRAEQGSRVDLA
jgi:hypothetical protein